MATKIGVRLSVAKGCLAVLFLGACSSSSGNRDQNWGSDVGRDFDGSIASDAPEEITEPSDASDASDELDTPPASDALDAAGSPDVVTPDVTPDVSGAETMDGGAMNAQDTVGLDARDGEAQ